MFSTYLFLSVPLFVLGINHDPSKFIQLSLAVSKSAYLPFDGEKFIKNGQIIENPSRHHDVPAEDKIACKMGGWTGLGHEKCNTELVLFKNVKQKLAIFGIRGTEDLHDWWENFKFWLVETNIGETKFSLHKGFKNCFDDIGTWLSAQYKQLPLDYTVILTGHSLGGAQATIAAAYVAGTLRRKADAVITFGSPKVGDANFQQYYRQMVGCERTIRIVNRIDKVPNVPPTSMGYDHVCPVTDVDGGANVMEMKDAHSLYFGYEPGIRNAYQSHMDAISYGCNHPLFATNTRRQNYSVE